MRIKRAQRGPFFSHCFAMSHYIVCMSLFRFYIYKNSCCRTKFWRVDKGYVMSQSFTNNYCKSDWLTTGYSCCGLVKGILCRISGLLFINTPFKGAVSKKEIGLLSLIPRCQIPVL